MRTFIAVAVYCFMSVIPVMMREANNIDIDTGAGFGLDMLFGAGLKTTLEYLERNDWASISSKFISSDEVTSEVIEGFKEDIKAWVDHMRNYHSLPGRLTNTVCRPISIDQKVRCNNLR